MKRRRPAIAGAVLLAAVTGSAVTIAFSGGSRVHAAPALPPVSTATVVRTNLATTVLTEGTLGYRPAGPVVNRVAGTYTGLPAPGTTIRPGRPLYRVDNLPVVLMAGTTPAWRPFALGMTGGPDVTELQANLIALGDAAGLFSAPTGQFDVLTADAVEHWQSASGYLPDGHIDVGQVVFLPTAVRVGAESAAPGQVASPGQIPYQVTTTARIVTVPLTPDLPTIRVGEAVSIVLPTSARTPGKIIAVGPAAPGAGSRPGRPAAAATGPGGSRPSVTSAVASVIPRHPGVTGTDSGVAVQVSLTSQSVSGVLAVPISALLALAGGGYGVEVVEPSGPHHLVGVTTGIFTGSQVQITAPGIEAGTKVVAAQ